MNVWVYMWDPKDGMFKWVALGSEDYKRCLPSQEAAAEQAARVVARENEN